MANISPCPFVVIPAVRLSENEEAAGVSRRPLSPLRNWWGGLPSRPVLRAQWPNVGVGAGDGEQLVLALDCHSRPGRRHGAAESQRGGAPAPEYLAVAVARHNGTPSVVIIRRSRA